MHSMIERVIPQWNWYIPGSTTNLGQGELDAPNLTLVSQTVLSDELQLGITTERRMSV
jgi:hypothetical protein